jgi:hypothetical protein
MEESSQNKEYYQNGEEEIDDYMTGSYKPNIKQGIIKKSL